MEARGINRGSREGEVGPVKKEVEAHQIERVKGGTVVIDPMLVKTKAPETMEERELPGEKGTEGKEKGEGPKGKEKAAARTSTTRKAEALKEKMEGNKTCKMEDMGGRKSRRVRRCASSSKKTPAPKVNPAIFPTTFPGSN